ncbi:glycolate oxidase subunit GlcF [Mesorhizobium soli]|uniref:Glycolate oxidase iron-sulfur subunit n=1 Tax=Pseudaminobacter soli (ex Li et al. 2025) TaxID=1295366 RepID=A0A2P7S2L7_9HYPH|nr:glycolate oxidase subunit GlcF [Mesorhizobium soli]PSJ56691.1 glycolate oxidase iron-sulfur subunit [Mesorhizobium soli]
MRTSFTPEQLRDPEIEEANGILETCVHYGFCTNTCPTYVLTRDENESPRGRIDLIREMLEQGGAPKPETVRHLDSCLSCLSCMSTCAAKVDYAHLIDRARVHVERHHRRPFFDRLLRRSLATVLTRPRMFSVALALGQAAKPFRGLMPARLAPLVDMLPSHAIGQFLDPAVFAGTRPARKRVALLAGCAQQALNGNINAATIRLLQRLGCDVVVVAGAGCCGSLPLHMGKEDAARALARQNVEAWLREKKVYGLDAIVINASGCGTTVKDYGHLLARDTELGRAAATIASLARDVSEVVAELGFEVADKKPAYRVAYHDPCSMQHGQKVTRQPRALLRAAGFDVLDVPEKHFCCGSAGTYNLLQPHTAAQLGTRKAGHIASTDPDIVATGNIGCMTQIQRYSRVPVLHTVELLDWATGGAAPPSLLGTTLREPIVKTENQQSSAGAADPGSPCIW